MLRYFDEQEIRFRRDCQEGNFRKAARRYHLGRAQDLSNTVKRVIRARYDFPLEDPY
jgi:hypothetical protein